MASRSLHKFFTSSNSSGTNNTEEQKIDSEVNLALKEIVKKERSRKRVGNIAYTAADRAKIG
jgi:hypothetical protein